MATRSRTSSTKRASANPGRKYASARKATIDADQRHQMVSEAAYYLAESRGFINGSAEEDWITAEAQIDALLSELH